MTYDEFIRTKEVPDKVLGFQPRFLPDGLFGFQKVLVEWAIRKGRAALFEDCVAGDTIISGPDGSERVDMLACKKESIKVWALNTEGNVVPAEASVPWVNGFAELYRVRMTSGRCIVVTKRHRFLTDCGWKPLSSLAFGDRLLVTDACHLQTSWETSRTTHREGGRHSVRTALDYPASCSVYSHQYDGRPLPCEDTSLGVFPSPGDAPGRNHRRLHEDGSVCGSRHSRLHLQTGPPAKMGFYARSETANGAGGECRDASLGTKCPIYDDLSSWRSQKCGTLSLRDCGYGESFSHQRSTVFQSTFNFSSLVSWDTISSIHYIRSNWFYDLWVPGYENYLASGFWSHNCGLGKSFQELVWSQNMHQHTNRNVLLLTPLAVGVQMVREGRKFGIECKQSRDGTVHKGITVTNYEQLPKFDPKDFAAVVCDDGAVLKGFENKYRKLITGFLHRVRYRLLATATPAPNDFMELGTLSEALGVMGRNQMLGMFFQNDGESTQQWSLKGHAKKRFWQWVSTWARAVRYPSDLGFPDDGYRLPELRMVPHIVPGGLPRKGLLPRRATTLDEQRAERKVTLRPRCEKVAEVVPAKRPCVVWCHLNSEGDLLEELVPDAVQVSGSDRDEEKEERFLAFADGQIRVLVTKPKIGGFGLNWQHCSDMTFFPSHSYEQFYQSVRRCWRFGQKRDVTAHLVTSEGEVSVTKNMQRKEAQVRELYDSLVREVNRYQQPEKKVGLNGWVNTLLEVPEWLR